MAVIEDSLGRQNHSGGSNKRKLSPTWNPNQLYKSSKVSANGDAKAKKHDANNGRHAYVDDEVDEDDNDAEAGPELPPEDNEEGPQDDDEGRFFGGGVSEDTAEVLDYIDSRDGNEDSLSAPEKFDSAWLKRVALNFERKISKNAELRAKFEDDPKKFMSSEADLDAAIKGLSILTEHSELYIEFAKMGCVASMVSLLAHDNTDIAIDTLEILSELTDEDVGVEQEQWDAVVKACMEADLPSLLIDNLQRMDEANMTDSNGVFHCLHVLENLASSSLIAEDLGGSSSLLKWLLARIQNRAATRWQNTHYASEVFSILLQATDKARDLVISLDGIDTVLQLLSSYRIDDPDSDSTEEVEYVENLFNALVCLVGNPLSPEISLDDMGRRKLVEGSGIELLILMLKQPKSTFSKPRALRVLNHSLSGPPSSGASLTSVNLVEEAGLKPVFSMFTKHEDRTSLEHLLGIFASLLRCIPYDSPARIRTLAKFMEKDYKHLHKLVKLRHDFAAGMVTVDTQIKAMQSKMTEEEIDASAADFLSQRLDAGLFCLQTTDVVLTWLIAEDSGAKDEIVSLLAKQDKSLLDIKASLEEQIVNHEETISEESKNPEAEDAVKMLKALVECLE